MEFPEILQYLRIFKKILRDTIIHIAPYIANDQPLPFYDPLYNSLNRGYLSQINYYNVFLNTNCEGFLYIINNGLIDQKDLYNLEKLIEYGEFFNNMMVSIRDSHSITEIHNVTANVLISNQQAFPNNPELVDFLNQKVLMNCFLREDTMVQYRVASENNLFGVNIYTREHMNMLEDQYQYYNYLCNIDYEPQPFFPLLEDIRGSNGSSSSVSSHSSSFVSSRSSSPVSSSSSSSITTLQKRRKF